MVPSQPFTHTTWATIANSLSQPFTHTRWTTIANSLQFSQPFTHTTWATTGNSLQFSQPVTNTIWPIRAENWTWVNWHFHSNLLASQLVLIGLLHKVSQIGVTGHQFCQN
jgi:hypothetical protein